MAGHADAGWWGLQTQADCSGVPLVGQGARLGHERNGHGCAAGPRGDARKAGKQSPRSGGQWEATAAPHSAPQSRSPRCIHTAPTTALAVGCECARALAASTPRRPRRQASAPGARSLLFPCHVPRSGLHGRRGQRPASVCDPAGDTPSPLAPKPQPGSAVGWGWGQTWLVPFGGPGIT